MTISIRVKAMTVRLPAGVSVRIDGLVGSKRRAEFIRSAVMKELRQREAARKKQPPKGK